MYKPFLGILTVLSLTACSDAPSEGDIRELVEHNLEQSGINHYVHIRDFELVDSIKRRNGSYDVDVNYILVVEKDSTDIEHDLKQASNSSDAGTVVLALRSQLGKDFKAGKELMVSDTLNLKSSDNGWLVP